MSPRRPDALQKEHIGYNQITIRVPDRMHKAIHEVDYKKLGYWSLAEWLREVLDKALKEALKKSIF